MEFFSKVQVTHKKGKELKKRQKTKKKWQTQAPIYQLFTLNVNGLNISIKK